VGGDADDAGASSAFDFDFDGDYDCVASQELHEVKEKAHDFSRGMNPSAVMPTTSVKWPDSISWDKPYSW